MTMREVFTVFLLSSLMIGCQSASLSPKPDSVSTETSTRMPSSSNNLQSQSWWLPTIGLTWQWQIGDNDIDTSIEANV
jgi:hypothetical protein